jgi:hypothetical protein
MRKVTADFKKVTLRGRSRMLGMLLLLRAHNGMTCERWQITADSPIAPSVV